jgi:hypothetical protein
MAEMGGRLARDRAGGSGFLRTRVPEPGRETAKVEVGGEKKGSVRMLMEESMVMRAVAVPMWVMERVDLKVFGSIFGEWVESGAGAMMWYVDRMKGAIYTRDIDCGLGAESNNVLKREDLTPVWQYLESILVAAYACIHL